MIFLAKAPNISNLNNLVKFEQTIGNTNTDLYISISFIAKNLKLNQKILKKVRAVVL